MSGLSGRLRSGGVRVVCGGVAEEEDCAEPGESWGGPEREAEEGGPATAAVASGSVGPGPRPSPGSGSGPVPVLGSGSGLVPSGPSASAGQYGIRPPHSLANGLRSHDNQRRASSCKHRGEEATITTATTTVATPASLHHQEHSDRQAHTPINTPPQRPTDTHTAQPSELPTESHTVSHTPGCAHSEMELESTSVQSQPQPQPQTQTHRQTPSPLVKPIPSALSPLSSTSSTLTSTMTVTTTPSPTTALPLDHTKPNHTTTTPPTATTPTAAVTACGTGGVGVGVCGGAPNTTTEQERKYTLRSSGRPRFPSHLRKSSRLRRTSESTRERQDEEILEILEEEEERVVVVKREERPVVKREERPVVKREERPVVKREDRPVVKREERPVVKREERPVVKREERPVMKREERPVIKREDRPVVKREERPVVKREEKAWRGGLGGRPGLGRGMVDRLKTERVPEVSPPPLPSLPPLPLPHLPPLPAPPPHPRPRPAPPRPAVGRPHPRPPRHGTPTPCIPRSLAECPICPPHIKRKGRFMGTRRIVVKVPRIPVHLSRRQKSYKISSLEPVGPWAPGGAGKEANASGLPGAPGTPGEGGAGGGPPREPTALLRMKNNGKSVMVMFPPGELPVILKRRRGRPPKQALPGQPDLKETRAAAAAIAAAGGNGEPVKKPRRRRRVKLPSPQPCYVTETNDACGEYADVLSKLAFLTRQPPPTGRCSPPRCWTPTQPESVNAVTQTPGLPALLQKLSGFRKRGGRGGGGGVRGGGAAGLGGKDGKSSFCEFFETIGKKRKAVPSEPGTPRGKRGKGAAGAGLSRAALAEKIQSGEMMDPMAPPGEKPPRKRRQRKNGQLKGGQGSVSGDDWANGSMGWGEGKRTPERYSLMSCSEGRGGSSGGMYGSPGVQSSSGGDDAQGLFAGYFRSLLDSDDSSDLVDMSSPAGHSKTPVGFEGSPHRWSPAFPKCSPKGQSTPTGEGAGGLPQTKSSAGSSTPARPSSYPYGQISPTTPTYSKTSALSQARSPSSTHPSAGYSPFPSGYNISGSSAQHPHMSSGVMGSPSQAQQRGSDCSFGFGPTKASSSPSSQCSMPYANYQQAAKCGYGSYSPGHSAMMRGEGNGPTSPGGGGYMMMSKSGHHHATSSSSAAASPHEEYRQYAGQWGYHHRQQQQQMWGGGAASGVEGFMGGHSYHGYAEYAGGGVGGITTTSPESKDILDISNYTPQKAKQQTRLCSDTFSESSSDSSHISGGGGGGGGGGARGPPPSSSYRQQREMPVMPMESQSSLSSLEKLMMDWNESSTGPGYSWSQSVLFQGGSGNSCGGGGGGVGGGSGGGGVSKQGRGRRKHSESPHGEKETCSPATVTPGSPVSPSSHGTPAKRGGVGGRGSRGSRGGRYGYSPCQRERSTPKSKMASQKSPPRSMFQDTLDYYSGDSSSLSPMSHGPETCEYPSPYSGHSSTASSDERVSQIYPSESTSLSPSPSMQLDILKPYPKPAQAQAQSQAPHTQYCPSSSSRTFSPTPSPTAPRLMPQQCGGSSGSKEPISQYDSPRYSSPSPCWYNPHAYEDPRTPPTTAKRDAAPSTLSMMSPGLRAVPQSPYHTPSPSIQRGGGPHSDVGDPEEYGYPRGGVLCQLLDQTSEDCFTSL